MDTLSFIPTILPENFAEGLIVNFGGELAQAINGLSFPVYAAEIKHVEHPDGLDGLGVYVMPEDAEEKDGNDLYLFPVPGVPYEIVG